MVKFSRHISLYLHKKITQTNKCLNFFFPSLCNTLRETNNARLHRKLNLPMQSFCPLFTLSFTLPKSNVHVFLHSSHGLERLLLNVNVVRCGKGWFTSFLFATFAKNLTRYRSKSNPIKFTIPCILPLTHNNL